MLIVQLSDPHVKGEGELLYGRIDTQGFLERAVAHVNGLDPRPDIALVTGDLVDKGAPAEYANLKRLLSKLEIPFYLIPGNHDARDALREAFPDHAHLPKTGFLQYVVEDRPLRLIALDTLVEGKGHGALCRERLDWLETRLEESDRATLLFMHHPPFDVGIVPFDAARLLEGGDRLEALVRAHGNVERVLCGHVHRPIQVRWAGTMASVAPSTAHQASLDLREDASLSMTMDPPAVALHLWLPATGLVTHASYVGSYEGAASVPLTDGAVDGPAGTHTVHIRFGGKMVATSTQGLIKRLGPGVITGAADDDPSGIATYSQAGAQAGFGLLWTVVLTWPLMVAVQSVSARIGRVTGRGLAANMCRAFPQRVVLGLVLLLVAANTINIGADLAAMGAAMAMLAGGGQILFTFLFAILSVLAIIFIPYSRYVGFLKYLTFSLFAYVGVVFTAHIDWRAVGVGALIPKFALDRDTLMLIVAIFGTTISPYLFFWQSSQEVEDEEGDAEAGPLTEKPEQAPRELTRIGWETAIGMAVSNLVAFFIILTTAATLNANGRTDIESTQQAAEALRPIAGDAAFLLFSLGIIGTGLLAVPVLAGSAAYALGEVRGWRIGLEHRFDEARPFYITIAMAIMVGVGMVLLPIAPFKALIWSAVLNGVIVVPIIGAMMIVASRRDIMGTFTANLWQRVLGWLTLVLMTAAAVGMFVLM